jgi:hypothetical protein
MNMVTVTNINGRQLASEFKAHGRADSFSSEGYDALASYYNELGEPWEVDPVAIDGEWCECTLEELVHDHSDYYLVSRPGDSGERYIVDFDGECFISIEDLVSELQDSHTVIQIDDDKFLITG